MKESNSVLAQQPVLPPPAHLFQQRTIFALYLFSCFSISMNSPKIISNSRTRSFAKDKKIIRYKTRCSSKSELILWSSRDQATVKYVCEIIFQLTLRKEAFNVLTHFMAASKDCCRSRNLKFCDRSLCWSSWWVSNLLSKCKTYVLFCPGVR